MTALQAELRTSDVLHEQLEFLLDRLAELLVAPLPVAPARGPLRAAPMPGARAARSPAARAGEATGPCRVRP